jgi:hypothetical protein
MGLLRLTCFPLLSLLLSVTQQEFQPPTLHPELIAGPWELASDSGIDGIFFTIVTSSGGPDDRQKILWQTIDIRVYHRQSGKETWGYFGTEDKATPESFSVRDDRSFTLFDGERLRIHFIDIADLPPFDLDITFSPTSHEWSGTWSRASNKFDVVLKRPAPKAGATPSVFVGDWAGDSATNSGSYLAPGSLHVCQSRDGTLSVWLDRILSGSSLDAGTPSVHSDQRSGERLQVLSATDSKVILETSSATSPPYQYRANLSEDHQVLTGTWERESGGRLNAPDTFRRDP